MARVTHDKILIGDFETSKNKDNTNTWVWSWVIYDLPLHPISHKGLMEYVKNGDYEEHMTLGTSIKSFCDYIEQLAKKYKIKMYFHNLKFDSSFIIDYLLRKGYTSVHNGISEKSKHFKTFIDDKNFMYSMEIQHSKRSKMLRMYDSLKLLPFSVSAMGKTLGIPKLDLDYTIERQEGHVIQENEKAYIYNDALIVGEMIRKMMYSNAWQGKNTVSGNALGHFKECLGNEFETLFPQLRDNIDIFVRESYRGGYTYVNPKHQGKTLGYGQTYDVNSLYPSVMELDKLPYGVPQKFKGKYVDNDRYPLYVHRVTCKFKLKKDFIPILQLKNNARFGRSEYIQESLFPTTFTCTSIDWEMINKHYDVWSVEYHGGYRFKAKSGMFKKYITHWKAEKIKAEKNGDKASRQLAKLMLNSLYGKFAQRKGHLDEELKEYYNIQKVPKLKDGHVIKENVHTKGAKTIYPVMASFITAYARRVTINAINEIGLNKFCYCDTDSIHFLGEEIPNIDIHITKFGAWKHEGNWSKAIFLRPKTYMEEIIGHGTDIKACGCTAYGKTKINWDNFKVGLTIEDGKTRPKVVTGGIVILNSSFSIK